MKQMAYMSETAFVNDFLTLRETPGVPKFYEFTFVLKFNPDTPVDVLEMSVRAMNSLKRSGINTLGKLCRSSLKNIRGCGHNTIKEINTMFLSYVYDTYNEEQKKEFWLETYKATMETYKAKARK